jgi:hypothetical protein
MGLLLHLLLPLLFPLFFHCHMMTHGAACHRPQDCMVMRVVTGDAADNGALQATRCEGRAESSREHNGDCEYCCAFH